MVPWNISLVSRDAAGGIEYFQMDPTRGAENFFAFGSGLPMEEPSRQSLSRAFKMMEDTSVEECHRLLNVSFGNWIDRNVEDQAEPGGLYRLATSDISPTYMSSRADWRTERSMSAQLFSDIACSTEAILPTSAARKT